jgi:hypothetical protein
MVGKAAAEAPNSKYQIPNKFKIQSSNDRNSLEFDIWEIGNYLGFGATWQWLPAEREKRQAYKPS